MLRILGNYTQSRDSFTTAEQCRFAAIRWRGDSTPPSITIHSPADGLATEMRRRDLYSARERLKAVVRRLPDDIRDGDGRGDAELMPAPCRRWVHTLRSALQEMDILTSGFIDGIANTLNATSTGTPTVVQDDATEIADKALSHVRRDSLTIVSTRSSTSRTSDVPFSIRTFLIPDPAIVHLTTNWTTTPTGKRTSCRNRRSQRTRHGR